MNFTNRTIGMTGLAIALALSGCGKQGVEPMTENAQAFTAEAPSEVLEAEGVTTAGEAGRGINYKQADGSCKISVKRWYCLNSTGKCQLSVAYLGPASPCGQAFSAACNNASTQIANRAPKGVSIGKCYPTN